MADDTLTKYNRIGAEDNKMEDGVPNDHEIDDAKQEGDRESRKAELKPPRPSRSPDERCCIGCLQRLATPYLFGFLMFVVAFFQSAAYACSSASLTTIEKRFQLKSSQLAPFFIVNDIIAVCLVLFVAYYGHRGHRPRLIGSGATLTGLGYLLCTLPQFIYDTPKQFSSTASRDWNDTSENWTSDQLVYSVCHRSDNFSGEPINQACTEEEEKNSGALMWQIPWIIIGQMLSGLGSSPIMPLSITYMDDGLRRTSTSVYVALYFMVSGFGPLFGFILSGFMLSKHADFLQAPVYAQPGDPNWLGAWWLGFAIIGAAMVVVGIPIALFPRRIMTSARRRDNLLAVERGVAGGGDEVEKDAGAAGMYRLKLRGGKGKFAGLKGFLYAVRRLVTNLSFVSLICGFCLFMMSFMGLFVFVAKYLETQFGLPPTQAPVLFGLIMTPATILGNLIGGFLVKKLKLTKKGMALMIVALKPVALLLTPALLFVGCDNPPIAGLTTGYTTPNLTQTPLSLPALAAVCNSDCACPSGYTPVCGSDGVTYVTPCHAGCLATEMQEILDQDGGWKNSITVYTHCSCVGDSDQPTAANQTAIAGACQTDCHSLTTFLVLTFTIVLLNTVLGNPGFMLQLRVVEEDDRSVAVGFTAMMMRLLGLIPSPILFGAVIQTACILLQSSCGETGNCLVYDIVDFRHVFFGLTLALDFLATVWYTVCYLFIRKEKNKEGFHAMAAIHSHGHKDTLGKTEQ